MPSVHFYFPFFLVRLMPFSLFCRINWEEFSFFVRMVGRSSQKPHAVRIECIRGRFGDEDDVESLLAYRFTFIIYGRLFMKFPPLRFNLSSCRVWQWVEERWHKTFSSPSWELMKYLLLPAFLFFSLHWLPGKSDILFFLFFSAFFVKRDKVWMDNINPSACNTSSFFLLLFFFFYFSTCLFILVCCKL